MGSFCHFAQVPRNGCFGVSAVLPVRKCCPAFLLACVPLVLRAALRTAREATTTTSWRQRYRLVYGYGHLSRRDTDKRSTGCHYPSLALRASDYYVKTESSWAIELHHEVYSVFICFFFLLCGVAYFCLFYPLYLLAVGRFPSSPSGVLMGRQPQPYRLFCEGASCCYTLV